MKIRSEKNKRDAVGTLARLVDAKAATKRAGLSSRTFKRWYQASLKVLGDTFGADSSYVTNFARISFEIERELVERAKRSARRIVHTDDKRNVTQVPGLKLPLEHAKAHHFEQAVDQAAEILQSAAIELKMRSDE